MMGAVTLRFFLIGALFGFFWVHAVQGDPTRAALDACFASLLLAPVLEAALRRWHR